MNHQLVSIGLGETLVEGRIVMDIDFLWGKEIVSYSVRFRWTVGEESVSSQTNANFFLVSPFLDELATNFNSHNASTHNQNWFCLLTF